VNGAKRSTPLSLLAVGGRCRREHTLGALERRSAGSDRDVHVPRTVRRAAAETFAAFSALIIERAWADEPVTAALG
jgi:hypothetical protein